MATFSARPTPSLRSTIKLALYHSGTLIMLSPLRRRPGAAELSSSVLGFGRRRSFDHDRLGLRVVIEGLDPVLLSVSALLPTAERQLVVDELRGVDPGIARLQSLGRIRSPLEVAGPDGGPEPVDRTVG